jgi:hypothetical protein
LTDTLSGERGEQVHIAVELSLHSESRDPCLGHSARRLAQLDAGVQTSLVAVLGNVQYFLTLLLLALCDLDELVGALELEIGTHHRADDCQSGRFCIEGSCVGGTTRLAQQRRLSTPEIQLPGKVQLLRASPDFRACIRVGNDVLATESPATLARVIRQARQ